MVLSSEGADVADVVVLDAAAPTVAGPVAASVGQLLLAGSARLAEATTEDAVCLVALEVALRALGGVGGALRVVDHEELRAVHQQVVPMAGADGNAPRFHFQPLPLDGPSAAALAVRRRELLVLDRPEDLLDPPAGFVANPGLAQLHLPLLLAGRAAGCLSVGFDGYPPIAAEVRASLLTYGTHVALALERVSLLRAQEQALTALAVSGARMAALQRVTRAFASSATVEEVFAAALDAVEEGLQPDLACAVRVDRHADAVRCIGARGVDAPLPGELLGPPFTATGPLGAAVRHGTANWYHGAEVTVPVPQGRAGGAVPLLTDSGPAGALAVLYAHSRPVPVADRTLLASIAELCGEALRRAERHELEQRQAARRLAVRDAGVEIGRAGRVEEVLDVAVRTVRRLVGPSWPVHAALADAEDGVRVHSLPPGSDEVAAEGGHVERGEVPLPVAAALDGRPLPARWLGQQLPIDDGHRGALAVGPAGTMEPPADTAALLGSIGRLAGEGLRRTLAVEQKHDADLRAAALHRVTRALSRSVTVGEVLQAAVTALRAALRPVSGGALLGTAVDGQRWTFVRPDGEVVAASGRGPTLVVPDLVLADGRPRFYESPEEVAADLAAAGVERPADPTAVERFHRAGLHLPLWVDGVTVGVIGCEFELTRRISAEEREFALSVASLAAEAIRRADHYEREHRNVARQAMLRVVAEEVADTNDPAVVLDVLEGALAALLGPLGMLALLERDGVLQRCRPDRGDALPPLLASLLGHDAVQAAGRFTDELFRWLPAKGADPGAEAAPVAGVEALFRGPDEVFGVLAVTFVAPRPVSPEDRAAVADALLAGREALRRARARAQEQRVAARTRVLHRVTEAVYRAMTSEDVLRLAVHELHDALGAVATGAGLVHDGEVTVVAGCGDLAAFTELPPMGVDAYWPVAEVLRTGQPLWHGAADPVLARRPAGPPGHDFTLWRAGVVLPIVVDGIGVGALTTGLADRRFEQGDRDLLESVARLCAEAMRRARLYAEATAAAARYEQLFRRHPQPLAVVDGDGRRFLAVNDAHVRLFGYDEGEFAELGTEALLATLDHAEMRAAATTVGEPPRHTRVFPLAEWRRKDGSTFVGQLVTSPVELDGVPARLALLTDETARVQAEADRARLQARVLSVAEEERRRISLDLHDGPVQDLSIAVMRLSALRHALERGEAATVERVRAIEHSTRLTVDELRGLMRRLYPTTLENADLVELLDDVIATGPWAATVDVRFHHALTCEVGLPVRAAVYRVVIEALTNVYKHAGACRAEVDLASEGGELWVRVADDGVGIDDGDHHRGGHLGLVSMQDRIALLGGTCTVGPGPTGGTVVEVHVPCPCPEPGSVPS